MLTLQRNIPRTLGLPRSIAHEAEGLFFKANAAYCVVDFLMPNGILIQHEVSTVVPLVDIKAEIWEKASEYPLIGLLPPDQTLYHFVCILDTSETQELMDESQCLRDIKLFLNILRVVERNIGNEEEKRLNCQIGHLIGKGLSDFDALKNPEVNDFRWKMRNECDEIVRERNKLPWAAKVQYLYPCRLAASTKLPTYIEDKVPNRQMHFTLQFLRPQKVEASFTILMSIDICPSELLEYTFRKKLNTIESDQQCKSMASEYILKVAGYEEYLVCEAPLSQYIAIQTHIQNSSPCQGELVLNPFQLIVVPKSEINVENDSIYSKIMESGSRPARSSMSASTLNKKHGIDNSWTITDNFKVKVGSLSKVIMEDELTSQVSVEAGLYHASVALCQNLSIPPVSIEDSHAIVEHELEFPIEVCHIPRSARLCLAVYEHTPVKIKGRPISVRPGEARPAESMIKKPIAWVNTSVYDYKSYLKGGSITLYCWSASEEQLRDLDLPYPLGTVVSNPNHERAMAITLTFTKYRPTTTVVFPLKETILARASSRSVEEEPTPAQLDKDELQEIAARDPLTELHEQERKKLWTFRRYCQKSVPFILPKLLQCVEWNNNQEVAEMLLLLEDWPKLPVDRALELLDYAYAESAVRNYSIDCLSHMSDDELLLYLLQLVQALKHENYLYCDLVQFLLQRALRNRRIGHFLFWYLRSEMHVPSVSIRFGLILEAYCRGSIEHMKLLQRQVDAFAKFKLLQSVVREHRNAREKAICALQEAMENQSCKMTLSNFVNPIEPTYRVSSVKVNNCKSMDSKMQPLWLVFDNSDPLGNDIYLLYKRGDDIRQDMLTLQMIRIMDKLWKDHGLDFRLNPYSCLSTDNYEGVIQIVTNAQTIANIQRKKGFTATSPFRKSTLYEWLETNNTSGLSNAIHEFTLSCAGYSVATYVLGIADRHNDNIMIMPNGQLFHIDFGHILGHFKMKFGIKRDQAFVLTHDFIYVIQNGKDEKSENFDKFKEYCEEAFMLLRRYGYFIISLFAMMISTGLPELQSEKDLGYLKETLKLNLNDEEALMHFRSKFHEALSNSWKVSINWAVHSISKNNR